MKRGFTLIETIMGLFLLGLIAVTVLPITNGAFYNLNKQEIKAHMIYTGEMAIEKLMAFEFDTSKELFIYDQEVSELIELFNDNEYVEVKLDKEGYEHPITIIKDNKSDLLWRVLVRVYNNEGGRQECVEFKAYLPKK